MADPVVATPPAPAQATPTPVDATKVAAAPAAVVAPVTKEPVAPASQAAPVVEAKPTLLGDPPKPSGEAKPPEKAPEPVKADYSKLALPKDSMIDQKALDSLKSLAEKRGLSVEAAQEMIDAQDGTVKAYHEGLLAGHQTQVGTWRKEVEAHPTLGGANLKATNEAVTQVLERFGPKGFMEEVQRGGFNWNPKFVELLHNVYAATKDDSFIRGAAEQPAKSGGLESMYDKKK